MGSLSIGHWGLLLVVAFLLLGRSRFSAAMGSVGQGLRNFRDGLAETSSAVDLSKTPEQAKPPGEQVSRMAEETKTDQERQAA